MAETVRSEIIVFKMQFPLKTSNKIKNIVNTIIERSMMMWDVFGRKTKDINQIVINTGMGR